MAETDVKTEIVPIRLFSSSSPHIRSSDNTARIMWTVNAALLPSAAAAGYFFGFRSLLLILISIAAAVITEALIQKYILKVDVTVSDGSAVLTGILLAFNVPPEVPLWLPALGSIFAIAIVKQCFGGLGYNIFNPALAGRAFLLAAYPVYMTTKWTVPQGGLIDAGIMGVDAVTKATPLAALKAAIRDTTPFQLGWENILDVFLGKAGGCIGETSALLLLIGGLFLLWRKIITWHIPVSYMATVFLLTLFGQLLTGHNFMVPVFHLVAGGLMLGVFFMATDYTTSPVTPLGRIIFGIGCGIFTVIIRLFGGYPEGVSYSILLMNAATPIIDRHTIPKKFGEVKTKKG